jgi:hypothetical protein
MTQYHDCSQQQKSKQQQERKQQQDCQHSMNSTKSRDACKNSVSQLQRGGRPTAAEIIGTSQRQQQKGDPEQQGCQKKLRLANNSTSTAGTHAAHYGRQQHNSQQLMSFHRNSPKIHQSGEKFVKKDVKKSKNSLFFVQ